MVNVVDVVVMEIRSFQCLTSTKVLLTTEGILIDAWLIFLRIFWHFCGGAAKWSDLSGSWGSWLTCCTDHLQATKILLRYSTCETNCCWCPWGNLCCWRPAGSLSGSTCEANCCWCPLSSLSVSTCEANWTCAWLSWNCYILLGLLSNVALSLIEISLLDWSTNCPVLCSFKIDGLLDGCKFLSASTCGLLCLNERVFAQSLLNGCKFMKASSCELLILGSRILSQSLLYRCKLL